MTEEERARRKQVVKNMKEFFEKGLERDKKLGLYGMTLGQRLDLLQKLKREKVKSDCQRMEKALDYAFK